MHKRERDIYRMTDQDSSSSTRPLADQESPFRTLGGGGGHTLQKVSTTSKKSPDFAFLCTVERFKTNLPA